MNSATKYFIKKNLINVAILYLSPIVLFLIISILSYSFNTETSEGIIFGNNIFISELTNGSVILSYSGVITPLIGIALIYMYRFIYNEKNNALISQYPIKEMHKLLIPLACLIVPILIYDLIVYSGVVINLVDNNMFVYLYLKYFVLCVGFLFIISSRSFFKLIVLCMLGIIAANQTSGLFELLNTQSLLSTMIVILICTLAILGAIAIHFHWLYKHDDTLLKLVYYLEIITIVAVFFRMAFIIKYPYSFDVGAIKIGQYSISFVMYLIVLVIISIYTYYREQKIDIKKIALTFIPIIVVSIGYLTVDMIAKPELSSCDGYINNIDKKYNSGNVVINGIDIATYDATIYKQPELKKLLKEKAEACYKTNYYNEDGTVMYLTPFVNSSEINYQSIKKIGKSVIEIGAYIFIVDTKEISFIDTINAVNDADEMIFSFRYVKDNEAYYIINLPKNISKTELDEMKKIDNNIIFLKKSEDKKLIDDILLSDESSDKFEVGYYPYYYIGENFDEDNYEYPSKKISESLKKKLDELVERSFK